MKSSLKWLFGSMGGAVLFGGCLGGGGTMDTLLRVGNEIAVGMGLNPLAPFFAGLPTF